MSESQLPTLPSSAQLLRATVVAVLVATALLVTIIWPAEFGRDPTGLGRALGVFRPAVDDAATADGMTRPAATPAGALLKSLDPYRTEEMTLTLQSGEGAEIKARMTQGQRLVFSWTTSGGGVDVDMHGEQTGGAEGAATSYWKDEGRTSGHGALDAPFTGNHGWFWQNLNDDPVTVTVKVSGFHQGLFRP